MTNWDRNNTSARARDLRVNGNAIARAARDLRMTNWEKHFRDMAPRREIAITFGADDGGVGPVESSIGDTILISQNLDAIRSYFGTVAAVTPAAVKLKDAFITWFDDLSWYQKLEQSTYDLARNQRNAFNLANAKSTAEKAAVSDRMKTGFTTEQLQVEPSSDPVETAARMAAVDRRTASGMLPGPVTPPAPMNKTALIVGGIALGVVVLKLVSKVLI